MRYQAGNCKKCNRPVEHIPGGFVHSETRAATCDGKMGGPHAEPDYAKETRA